MDDSKSLAVTFQSSIYLLPNKHFNLFAFLHYSESICSGNKNCAPPPKPTRGKKKNM